MFGLGQGTISPEEHLKRQELEMQMKIAALQHQYANAVGMQQSIQAQSALQPYLAQYQHGLMNQSAGINSSLFGLGQYADPKFTGTWLVLYHNALGVARDLRFAGEM